MSRKFILASILILTPVTAMAQEATPMSHNGSEMRFTRDRGYVEIRYRIPRPGLPVREGTLLFKGQCANGRYVGTAYTFKAGCAPAPYPVYGRETDNGFIVLHGPTPVRSRTSCDVIDDRPNGAHSRLVFEFEPA